MSEQLYTIPVKEAFELDVECPVCAMKARMEKEIIDFVMGPSYMEDDVRGETDKAGFCKNHVKMVYDKNNRLGMAWIAKTHMDKINKDIAKLQSNGKPGFMKKGNNDKLLEYLDKLNSSCYVCNRSSATFKRYIDTILVLYKSDDDFVRSYSKSKGFCLEHYGILIREGEKKLGGKKLEDFLTVTNKLFIDNMNRVRDDVAWFINKFDYKYKDEPWKEAKDSLPRAMTKLNSYYVEEEK